MELKGRQFSSDRKHEKREPRGNREQVEIPPVSEYRRMLLDHLWSFNTDTLYDFTNSRKQENLYYHIATRAGLEYTLDYIYIQQNALNKRIQKEVTKKLEEQKHLIETGDDTFDEFRRMVNSLDWYYDFSDDPEVRRCGASAVNDAKKYAEYMGGMYLTYFNKKHNEIKKSITG